MKDLLVGVLCGFGIGCSTMVLYYRRKGLI